MHADMTYSTPGTACYPYKNVNTKIQLLNLGACLGTSAISNAPETEPVYGLYCRSGNFRVKKFIFVRSLTKYPTHNGRLQIA